MFKWRKKRIRKKRVSSVTKHYVEHKEAARELVCSRLSHFNQHYGLKWNRVAIRNQRRCWGSCSSLKNLNFNYKILLLPPHLQDYIIVHEMCHLKELNHGAGFWNLVGEAIPEYKKYVAELKMIDKYGHSVGHLEKVQAAYISKLNLEEGMTVDCVKYYPSGAV
jgi:predicted metal-dependent hydrolase